MTEKTQKLMRMTGQGKMSCEINLQLCGGSIEKAIERMKRTYPSLVINSLDEDDSQ